MKRAVLCIAVMLSAIMAVAQETDNYGQLVSSGSLPEDFTKRTQDKVRSDIQTLDDKNYNSRRSKEQYILEASYLVDELMKSGKVLVNDPLGIYVNKVADELLKNDPDLRGQLKIYVVKSPVVNAFTFDKGVIFVNVGLLAQLENEAQLAFILAHEIAHYTRRHAINAYVEYDRIDRDRSDYRRSSHEDKIIDKSNYSKELELEADLEGLLAYMKTNYSLKAVSGAFDVLQYSYLPFEEIEFDKSFLETAHLILPDAYFLKETAQIKADDDYDDSKSTHPNIRKRRTAIAKKLEDADDAGRKRYIVSEEDFKKVREMARFEICRLYLIYRDYPEALYSAYILLKKYPDNLYLQKIVSKALFGMAAYKNKGRIRYDGAAPIINSDGDEYNIDDYDGVSRFRIPSYEDIEGSSQQVYHLLDKLNRDEMSVVALAYAWKVRRKAPDDPMLNAITDSLFAQVVLANNLTMTDFSKRSREDIRKEVLEKEEMAKNDSINAEKKEEEEEESKYKKIKQKQAKTEVEEAPTPENFIKYAFVDLLADKEFNERFEHFISKVELIKQQRKSRDNMTNYQLRKEDERLKKQRKDIKKNGLSLGINKVVIIDPYYTKIDRRKNASVKYFASETSQQQFTGLLASTASKTGLQYELIDPNSFDETDIEKFNDYSVINDWVVERFNHEERALPIVTNTEAVKNLVEKYGTKYFMWTGVVNVREKKEGVGGMLLLTTIFYPLLPYGVYYAASPQYETLYYTIVFDVETGELKMLDVRKVQQKDTNDFLSANVYDVLKQVKKTNAGSVADK